MTALRTIKRIIVAVAGGTVLALGIALIVLPGPAFLVISARISNIQMRSIRADATLKLKLACPYSRQASGGDLCLLLNCDSLAGLGPFCALAECGITGS